MHEILCITMEFVFDICWTVELIFHLSVSFPLDRYQLCHLRSHFRVDILCCALFRDYVQLIFEKKVPDQQEGTFNFSNEIMKNGFIIIATELH